jgi:cytochrome P450
MIECIRDKNLFAAIRSEASSAFLTSQDGSRKLDLSRLVDLPLLQSLYAEVLRLHHSINITREVTDDMVLDGWNLKKGYLIQAPSHLSHVDESVWGEPGHPASAFWAERHLVSVQKTDSSGQVTTVKEFSMAKRTRSFFPYGKLSGPHMLQAANRLTGGGLTICPGRHMAKREIMVAVATLVVNFDIELLDYVTEDGTRSDRGPADNPWNGGFGSMPPDRELKIRWKRV